ncbi:MAG TPA: threonylcarbamoyl-AMP synthase [Spirochaetia bacterium]|nr:threonylcarbamoyl-AMP synthase [Spirochaetia bacterium]
MQTQILKMNLSSPLKTQLEPALTLLKKNEIAAFPTETVYGLGANGFSKEAVAKIFEAKGRPSDNPLILHISNWEMLQEIAVFNQELVKTLSQKFWPGPLTLVLKRKDKVPDLISAGLPTVAVRFPSHPIALALISGCAFPLAAPSANRSGRPSPTTAEMVYKDLNGKIPMIVDGGECTIGLESTVLALHEKKPVLLRPGAVTYEELKEILSDLTLSHHQEHQKVHSPGMKYTHYKPKSRIVVFENMNQLDPIILKYKKLKTVCFTLDSSLILRPEIELILFEDALEMSRRLYSLFIELEGQGVDLILIQAVSEKGIGRALMNRILKAADEVLS